MMIVVSLALLHGFLRVHAELVMVTALEPLCTSFLDPSRRVRREQHQICISDVESSVQLIWVSYILCEPVQSLFFSIASRSCSQELAQSNSFVDSCFLRCSHKEFEMFSERV